jgi:hypothetical protein
MTGFNYYDGWSRKSCLHNQADTGWDKKSLKISKSSQKRRTDNTMIYKTLHKTLKIEQHKPCTPFPPKKNKTNELRCSGRVGSPSSTSATGGVILLKDPVISYRWWKGGLWFDNLSLPAEILIPNKKVDIKFTAHDAVLE